MANCDAWSKWSTFWTISRLSRKTCNAPVKCTLQRQARNALIKFTGFFDKCAALKANAPSGPVFPNFALNLKIFFCWGALRVKECKWTLNWCLWGLYSWMSFHLWFANPLSNVSCHFSNLPINALLTIWPFFLWQVNDALAILILSFAWILLAMELSRQLKWWLIAYNRHKITKMK